MPSQSGAPEEKRLVIGIAGRIGAGKTSAARYLNTKHGFQYLRYSQVLAEWMAANPGSKAELQSVGFIVFEKKVDRSYSVRNEIDEHD